MAITPNAANKMPILKAARSAGCRDDIDATLKMLPYDSERCCRSVAFF